MRLLLDTHASLWFILDDPRLTAAPRSLMQDPNNELLLSAASHWEIAINASLGKLTLHEPYDVLIPRVLSENGMSVLPIELSPSHRITLLPFHHRDPFDRMLVAQAMVEQIPPLSADSAFDAYTITRIWN